MPCALATSQNTYSLQQLVGNPQSHNVPECSHISNNVVLPRERVEVLVAHGVEEVLDVALGEEGDLVLTGEEMRHRELEPVAGDDAHDGLAVGPGAQHTGEKGLVHHLVIHVGGLGVVWVRADVLVAEDRHEGPEGGGYVVEKPEDVENRARPRASGTVVLEELLLGAAVAVVTCGTYTSFLRVTGLLVLGTVGGVCVR